MKELNLEKEPRNEVLSWIKSVTIAFVLMFVISKFLFSPVVVSGQSMEPTFESEDRIIISKIKKIERFDLVVFHAPGSNDDYIKRVIGLPGDTVVMKNDHLFINELEYDEPYVQVNKDELIDGQKLTEDFEVTVQSGQLFVLGDNRRFSKDSRMIGSIDQNLIVGIVEFRYYPFKSIGSP